MAESTYYSPTAWQSGREEQPRRRGQLDTRSRSFRFQWAAGQKLPKDYIQDLVPGDFLETWPPGQDEDTNWYVEQGYGKEKRKVPIAWINQESIRWATLPSSSWRWLLLKVFAKFSLILGEGLLLLTYLSVALFMNDNDIDKRQLFEEGFFPMIVYGGGAAAL